MLATLKYLADIPLYHEEKPYTLFGFPDDVEPKSNCQFETHDGVRLINCRLAQETFALQDRGFEFLTLPTPCDLKAVHFETPSGREEVWKYLIDTIDTVKAHLAASKVLCFDWRFRRTGSSCGVNDQLEDLENATYRALAPAALMHCDYSYQGGMDTLEIHLTPEERADIDEGRCRARIVKSVPRHRSVETLDVKYGLPANSVWRPLQTVRHSPLVICDPRSVNRDDVLEVDQVAPTKVELSLSLQHRDSQKYYWMPEQTRDEVIIFTSWDSVQSEFTASHTPHGAWMNGTERDVEPRESVEVRLIVLWNNE